MLPPSAGDVIASVDLGQQIRNVFGRVLQVAIHRDNHVALGQLEPGRQRRCLSEIPPEHDHPEPRIMFDQRRQQLTAGIARIVVDEDNFKRRVKSLQNRYQAVIQRQDMIRLVVNRYDDRKSSLRHLSRGNSSSAYVGSSSGGSGKSRIGE